MTVRSLFDSTEPGLQAEGFLAPTMRSILRTAAAALSASCTMLGGCRTATIPSQVLTGPAPVASAPATPVRTTGLWSYRPSLERQRFVLDQRAVIGIRADSVVNTDTVSSHVEVSFTTAALTNGVSGNVTAFLVQSEGHDASTPAGVGLPFPFNASYSQRGLQADFTAPRDASPCASSALAVAQSLRDLWFRPPDTLRVGGTWEDSASYVLCRDGIPLNTVVHRLFRITGTAERDGRTLLSISRASRMTIDGSGAQFGEPVSVSGNGNGDLVYVFDPAAGEVTSASGTATMDLTFRSGLRTQEARQVVEVRIGRS
jgi:hypothetical protein